MEKTVFEVEEFLKRPLALKQEIRAEEDHIASLRSIVDDRTTHLSHTAGRNPSKNNDAFENVMLEIVEAEKDLEEKRQKLTYSRRLVEALINQMPGEKERQILRYKYLKGLQMGNIRYIMELPKSTAYDLQVAAMKQASKIYCKMQKNNEIRTLPDSSGPVRTRKM